MRVLTILWISLPLAAAFFGVYLIVMGGLPRFPSHPGMVAPATGPAEPVASPVAEAPQADTEAHRWGRTVRIALDMRLAAYGTQMPYDGVETHMTVSRSGRRIHTMTWLDGSVVVTRWYDGKPGDGLFLHSIQHIGMPDSR